MPSASGGERGVNSAVLGLLKKSAPVNAGGIRVLNIARARGSRPREPFPAPDYPIRRKGNGRRRITGSPGFSGPPERR